MFRSVVQVTIVGLGGSFLGLIVQILIAHRFGLDVAVDAYLFSISIPLFVSALLGHAISYAAIPQLSALSDAPDNQKKQITSLLQCGFVFCLSILFLTPVLSFAQKLLLPGNSQIARQLPLDGLLYLAWVICGFQMLLSSVAAILTARGRPVESTALTACPQLGAILPLAFATEPSITHVAEGLLVGTVICLFMGVALTPVRIDRRLLEVRASAIPAYFASNVYAVVAILCFSFVSVSDAFWAPRVGGGALATVGLIQRIVIGFGTIAVIGPSAVVVPRVSSLLREGKTSELRGMLIATIVLVLLMSLVLAAFLAAYSSELVGLLFGRGQVRQAEVNTMADSLPFFLPGMICMIVSVVSLRILFCFSNAARIGAALGVGWVVTYFTLSGPLSDLGPRGFGIAYSLTWGGYLAIMTVVLHRLTAVTPRGPT